MTAAGSLDALVDPLVGIVVETSQLLDVRASPSQHSAHVVVADPALTVGTDVEFGGGGAGADAEGARRAAIGEAVERYSASFVDERRLVRASERQLDASGIRHVALDDLRLFTDEQLASWRRQGCGYEDAAPDRPLTWVAGHDLDDRSAVLVPAQFVFLAPVDRLEPHLGPQVSTGLALAATPAAAALSGLLECVERDAFMLTWELSDSPPRIDVEGDPWLAATVDELCAESAVEWSALWVGERLGVPAVTVCCRYPGEDGVGLAVGAAAAMHARPAVAKAMREAFQTLQWARILRADRQPTPEAVDVRSFEDHVRFWADPANAGGAAFLTAASTVVPVTDLPSLATDGEAPVTSLRRLVDHLATNDVHTVVVDVTSPDVAAAGFHVARVLAPELCLLDVEFSARFHGRPRLLRAASQHGVTELNPLPHPFP